jgi:hypothetical protein
VTYAYTQENRLEHPHRYMYTPFEGLTFLEAFLENRQLFLSRYDLKADTGIHSLHDDYLGLNLTSQAQAHVKAFQLDEPVVTIDLLNAVVQAQIDQVEHQETKHWLDRLVQRFEVNKKIFVTYLPGFRKGEGAADVLELYWKLAVALYLQYESCHGLKYLSTALKITDLLCSVPFQQLSVAIPDCRMNILLQAEIRMVKALMREKINGLPT